MHKMETRDKTRVNNMEAHVRKSKRLLSPVQVAERGMRNCTSLIKTENSQRKVSIYILKIQLITTSNKF